MNFKIDKISDRDFILQQLTMSIEVNKKRKFESDESEAPSKQACFEPNLDSLENTNDSSELCNNFTIAVDSKSSSSYSMECNNEIEMKEESSGSCGADTMISIENPLEFIYNTQKLEDYTEKDIEDILFLDDETNYVLSSGRWAVNQDSTRHAVNKPTIDQEFEQYFSTLML